MAPMTRYFSPDGVPTENVAKYYALRARAGVGLLISEGAYVGHPSAHAYTNVPQFYGDGPLAGGAKSLMPFTPLAAASFRSYGTRNVTRTGMQPNPTVPGFVPSEVSDSQLTKEMTEEDIADIIDAYARSASTPKPSASTASRFMVPTDISLILFSGTRQIAGGSMGRLAFSNGRDLESRLSEQLDKRSATPSR